MSETLGEVCARLAGVERDGTFQAAVATALRGFADLKGDTEIVQVDNDLALWVICWLPGKARRDVARTPEECAALPIDDVRFVLSCRTHRGSREGYDLMPIAIADGQAKRRQFVGYDTIKNISRIEFDDDCIRLYPS